MEYARRLHNNGLFRTQDRFPPTTYFLLPTPTDAMKPTFTKLLLLLVTIALAILGLRSGLALAGTPFYRSPYATSIVTAQPTPTEVEKVSITLYSAELRGEQDPWKAAPGFAYLILDIEVLNTAVERMDVISFDFRLRDADGYEVQASFWSESPLTMAVLAPGESVRGKLAFEVSEPAGPFTLALVDSFYGSLAQVEITDWVDQRHAATATPALTPDGE